MIIALSASGETEELLELLPMIERLSCALICFCGAADSTLAQASTVWLDASVAREAGALNLAPTASTTVMLALGDALALEVHSGADSRLRTSRNFILAAGWAGAWLE